MAEGFENWPTTPNKSEVEHEDTAIPSRSEAVETSSLPSAGEEPRKLLLQTNILIPDTVTARHLLDEITEHGGIPYSRFMEISLYGPDGYYSSGKVKIGASFDSNEEERTDFITSPEYGPTFGGLLGVRCRDVWESMGSPDYFPIIEMGAGTGAMAVSLQEWASADPVFSAAVDYIILERAQGLIPQQQEKVGNEFRTNWVFGSAIDLPFREVKGVFISNELVDAFPVERVHIDHDGQPWQIYVNVINGSWVEEGHPISDEVKSYLDGLTNPPSPYEEYTVNLCADRWQKGIAAALSKGSVITIDYGSKSTAGDRLSGSPMRFFGKGSAKKTSLDQYRDPGAFDITCDIDFAHLEGILEDNGLEAYYSGGQRTYLNGAGPRIDQDIIHACKIRDAERLFQLLHFADWLQFRSDKGDFYVSQYLKGIELDETENADKVSDLTLKVKLPYTEVTLRNGNDLWGNENPNTGVNIRFLLDYAWYSPEGNLLCDFTDQVQAKAFLDSHDWEIEVGEAALIEPLEEEVDYTFL